MNHHLLIEGGVVQRVPESDNMLSACMLGERVLRTATVTLLLCVQTSGQPVAARKHPSCHSFRGLYGLQAHSALALHYSTHLGIDRILDLLGLAACCLCLSIQCAEVAFKLLVLLSGLMGIGAFYVHVDPPDASLHCTMHVSDAPGWR